MRVLTDCFFGTGENLKYLIDPENFEGDFSLGGHIVIGERLGTSPVQSIEGDGVTTLSGSHYKIVNFNRQYDDFIKAKREGIPIVEKWEIDKFLKFYLAGEIEGEEIDFFILNEEGNFIISSEGQKYFLIGLMQTVSSNLNFLWGILT